jgi:hypothetical protein
MQICKKRQRARYIADSFCNICTDRVTLRAASRSPYSFPGLELSFTSHGLPLMPQEEVPTPRFRRSVPAAPGRRTSIILVLILLAAAGLAWYFFSSPRLVFTNELHGPIRVVADQRAPLTVLPGASVRLAMARGQAGLVQWELVRPVSADGRPMGSEVRGSVVLPDASGTVRRSARARGTDADYFAPLITNASDEQLRIRVNAGLEGALDCGCAVRPAARRVFIGYYPLYQNSTVRATAPDGRSATFRGLGTTVSGNDGSVGLRFESGDLR